MGNFAENLNLGNRFRPPLILTLKFSILKGTPQILLICILKNANVIIFPKNDTFWEQYNTCFYGRLIFD